MDSEGGEEALPGGEEVPLPPLPWEQRIWTQRAGKRLYLVVRGTTPPCSLGSKGYGIRSGQEALLYGEEDPLPPAQLGQEDMESDGDGKRLCLMVRRTHSPLLNWDKRIWNQMGMARGSALW